jgi:hypothetical protein
MEGYPIFTINFSKLKCRICGFIKPIVRNKMTKYYVSVEDYLMGRDKTNPPDDEMISNYNTLIPKVNDLLDEYYKQNPYAETVSTSSGYRTPDVNANTPGASKTSWHMKCAAIDIRDRDKNFGNWCNNNITELNNRGLYMESLETTHEGTNGIWCHLQIYPPKSGSNPFKVK